MEHYLDNSATTRVYPQVAQKVYEILTEKYGNPSSLHTKGMEAEDELEKARSIIAKSLNTQSNEIYFTSGGTEANNLAVIGAVKALKRRGNKIVATAFEHSSVHETLQNLEAEGFEVVYIKPDESGQLNPADFEKAIDDKTILVTVMAVNNELGTIAPLKEISKIVKAKNSNAFFHSDCVQAYCKIPLKMSALGLDLATITAHKIHGPKGVGALYIKKGVRILPNTFGGEQEKKIRPGTEPLPLIAGFGEACKMVNIEKNYEKIQELNAYAKEKLLSIDGVTLNSPENALPYILNISANGVRSETMLHFLEEREIYVSSGSACAKGKPSHVLQAIGLNKKSADSALRISFSSENTKEDIDALAEAVTLGLKMLVKR